jgi:N utilization substance protein B
MTTPRRRAREFALQGIYQWQFTGEGAAQVLKNLSELDEFDSADQPFLKAQLTGTIKESGELRLRIEPLVDRKWEELSPIERGILLLAAWELVHKPDIPYRVTINEAIELGKRLAAPRWSQIRTACSIALRRLSARDGGGAANGEAAQDQRQV